jgi:hypothetical protein
MEAYRIDRFGSVDGIVLRSSEDPRPGPKEILMRVDRRGARPYRRPDRGNQVRRCERPET